MEKLQMLEKDTQNELSTADEAQNAATSTISKSKKRQLDEDVKTAEVNCIIMSTVVNCVEHFDIKKKKNKTSKIHFIYQYSNDFSSLELEQHVKKFLIDGDGPGYKVRLKSNL
jgi:hypothetical protein